MNPETPKPSREEIEVRLTALLLGELPAEEAALLRWAIEQNAELSKLHERLKRAIELTREVAANPAETATTHTAPLKLSDERREKLLAHFKTVKPKEFVWNKRIELPRWLEIAAVLAFLALLAAMLLPSLASAKRKSMRASAPRESAAVFYQNRLGASSNDRMESGKAAHGQYGSSVNSETVVGFANIPADSLPPKESLLELTPSPGLGTPLADAPVEKRRYANNIVLPPAATDVDRLGTTAYADNSVEFSGAPSGGFFDANGRNEVAARDQSVHVGHLAGGADPNQVLQVLREKFPNNSGSSSTKPSSSATSALMQRQQNNATGQANSSSTLTASISGGGNTGGGGFGGFGGFGGGGRRGGGGASDKRENTSVEVGDSGTVSSTPADKSKFVSDFDFALESQSSQIPFRSGKQDGINLNVVELNVQKPVDETPWASGYKTQSALVGYDDPGAFTPKAQSSIVIKYALASDIASALNSAGGAISSPVPNSGATFAVDPQTHEIIFNADAETTKQIKEVIAKLDSPLQQGLIESVVMDVANGDTFTVQNGIVGQDKVPLLGDLPATGRLWRSESKAVAASDALFSETPAASTAPVSGNSLFLGRVAQLKSQAAGTSSAGEKILVPGAVAANWNTDGDATLSKGLTRVGSGNLKSGDSWQSFDGTAQAPAITSGGTLALNGTLSGNNTYNTYNGGTVVNGGTITFQDNISDGIIASASSAANPEGTFPGSAITGLTKDDVGGLRYLVNNGSGQVAQSQETEANFGFADTMHQKQGNVALADGSAQQFTTARFRSALTNSLSGTTANRLAFQTADAGAPKNLGEEYRKVVSVTNSFNFATIKNLPALQLVQNKLTVATPVQQQMQQAKETDADVPVKKPAQPAPIPQPEIQTRENNFSTFSLNVSDVSFKLAAASLEKGQLPEAASIRSEEFINAFDYRDPEAAAGVPVAFASERARYPFAHNRELLRFSVKTAAQGRQAGRPLNLVLLLDNSGSMERADRVAIIREALRVLAAQLQPQDKISVITFARTPRLWVDGVSGDKTGEALDQVSGITPEGGTNLEEAMNLAYQTALRHYLANGANRVVLLTDGAANLGNVDPDALKQKVEAQRKQGIALDCFGIGWEGFNDDLLEVLSRNGDGRYGFINTPEEAATGFAGQLAGALKVAASDVKVQVEFNPKRVTSYRQIGYAKHQLTKQQFRDNTVDAAEIAAQEAGNALYTIETNPGGEGPIATVRVRYKIPGTMDYREQAWDVPYAGNAVALEQSSSAMRLAATASAFSEWLASSPFAQEVTPDQLLNYLNGVPEIYGADQRPKKLEWMIRQAKSVAGK